MSDVKASKYWIFQNLDPTPSFQSPLADPVTVMVDSCKSNRELSLQHSPLFHLLMLFFSFIYIPSVVPPLLSIPLHRCLHPISLHFAAEKVCLHPPTHPHLPAHHQVTSPLVRIPLPWDTKFLQDWAHPIPLRPDMAFFCYICSGGPQTTPQMLFGCWIILWEFPGQLS